MDVSIIIINYNTLDLTKNTIDSVIEKTNNLEYEIILVDNNSTDGSVEFFSKNYQDKIIFIKNKSNYGFGKANNIGAKKAKGKYLFLLNSDTLLLNNSIKILFDFMEKTKECGVCGGNLYNFNLEPTASFSLKMMSYNNELINKLLFKFRKIETFFNETNLPQKVEIIIGADFFIRRNVYEQLKGFDEDFFMYHEESELCFRVLKLGYSIYNISEAKIMHLEGKSSKVKLIKFEMERESKYLFFYKTKGSKSLKYVYILSQIYYLIYSIYKREKELLKINRQMYLKVKERIKNIK